MLKAPYKLVCLALLLMVFCGQAVSAQNKVYQYDGKLPFVQMMLNMMTAMGILDRLPSNGAYGSTGYGNQFSRTPWSQTPWSSSAVDGGASPIWGTPSWGVLPSESYASNNYSYYNRQGLSPTWSSTNLDGWVNETWETSSWNPQSNQPVPPRPKQGTQKPAPQVVQNFNYSVPQGAPPQMMQPGGNRQNSNQYSQQDQDNRRSPLARLSQQYGPQQQVYQQQAPQQQASQQHTPQQYNSQQYDLKQRQNNPPSKPITKKKPIRQKPCVTEFCGLKKPVLDGLWVAKNGEMLGVKDHRYLWSDNKSKYLTGKIKIQNEYLLANVDGYDKIMRFKYKLAGNHLLTLQPDGKIREFTRTRSNQYQGAYYEQGYGNGNYYRQ